MIKDYNQLTYSRAQYIKEFIIGGMIGVLIGYIFYRSFIGSLFLFPYGYLYCKNKKIQDVKNRKWKLNLQFKDALLSISTALSAGYSIENSFIATLNDLKLIYPLDSIIVEEFSVITQSLYMNDPLEKSLKDLSKRCDIDDIINFSNVLFSSLDTGGDVIKIVKASTDTINNRIEVKREIQTLITAKQLEANIMSVIPIGIILYLNLCSPGFLEPLYEGIFGRVFMTVLLVFYYFAYQLSKKIVDIKF